ncbi:hypothetical protein CPC197_0966B, partial [Chlamydia psittaci C1/97]
TEPKLQTAVSFSEQFNKISVHKFEQRTTPT